MGRKFKSIDIINIICVAAALLATLPLLILGSYSYPLADDWSLGRLTGQAVRDGEGIIGVFRQAVNSMLLWREKGEPRFSAAFLGTLQPGIWGEHFYKITSWMMIGGLYFSELLLCSYLLKNKERTTRKLVLPIILPTLVIQLMSVPYPEEAFYWYVGGMNYTFIFSLTLVLLYCFLKLKEKEMKRGARIAFTIFGSILAVIVGGNNYSASVSSVCVFVSFSCLMAVRDRKALARTLPITLLTIVSLAICLIAPGNLVRLNDEFGGRTTDPIRAILMSLWRTLTNIYSWTSIKIIIMVVLIAPFLWKAMRRLEKEFRYPLLFTAFTFGIYSSQIVATMYVDGSTGGGRIADILYYGYHIWVVLNAGYWIGWIQRRRWPRDGGRISKACSVLKEKQLLWFCTVGIILAVFMGATELRTLSTYKACAWLVNGTAREYAQAWEERLAVLHDESVKEVYFEPLPGYEGEMIFYADLQYDENNWLNKACAEYYNKNFVKLK